MKPRSMVTRQSIPGPRSRLREAAECAAFFVVFALLLAAMSLEAVR